MKIITSIIISGIIIFILLTGIIRYEKYECHLWANQSKMHNEWYFTQWQKDQCLQYKINF